RPAGLGRAVRAGGRPGHPRRAGGLRGGRSRFHRAGGGGVIRQPEWPRPEEGAHGMIGTITTMLSLLLCDPPRPRPAAMVLDLKGSVQLRSVGGEARPAKVCDLLYAGDRLAIPADGAATVAILGLGAQERLASESEAT